MKYLMTNKSLFKQKYFSVITKNSNWVILAKNLVTFKRYDGVMDEKIYFGGSQSDFQGEGGSQKTNIEAGLPKKGGGAWTVCRFKGGAQ